MGIDPGTIVAGCACLELVERRASSDGTGGTLGDGPRPLARRASNCVQRGTASAMPLRVVHCSALRLGRTVTVGERLGRLAVQLDELLDQLRPDEVALEAAFGGKSVQSALRIGEARGVVIAAAYRRGLTVHQYPPARIKRCVAGSGQADKAAVARMVTRTLGLDAIPEPVDITDALAVALTRVEERRSPQALV